LYNCGGAQQLGKPSSSNCCQLCYCLVSTERSRKGSSTKLI
jgi:hypothetical protein